MPATSFEPHLIDHLPKVRGRLTANAPLAQRTWFRVGGPAEVLFRPADTLDLAEFLCEYPQDVPRTVIGAASNLLIRDGGIPGVTIRLTSCCEVEIFDDMVMADAGALDATVSLMAQEHGLTGLEFLSGIPGSIGGALAMNAGCYGRELSDVLIDADMILHDGTVCTMDAAEMELSYRHSNIPYGGIVGIVRLRASRGDPAEIARTMDEIRMLRMDAQPIRARTGGSTFANPEGDKAWRLIDAAGCRGLTIGGAQVSEKHCNFLINTGEASAADLENLGEEVRRRVADHSGVELRWEIKRIGVAG